MPGASPQAVPYGRAPLALNLGMTDKPEPEVLPRFGEIDTSTAAARRQLHEENRLSWNAATKAHNSHKLDQAKFLREGGNKLFPEEIDLLGDVHGQSVLHLQCNSGQDTLCIKKLGAATVTGVDISDEAIAFARQLSADSGLEAAFHRADVYDWLQEAGQAEERWDIVFCSYGAVIWLSDLGAWARGIARVLKPGGRFALMEFHPVAWMFDDELRLRFPYSSRGKAMTWDDGISDYVGESGAALTPSGWTEGVQGFTNPHRAHEFSWGTSDVITALLEAGLALDHFKEYVYLNGPRAFKALVPAPEPWTQRRWVLPESVPSIPLMYSVAARKPAT